MPNMVAFAPMPSASVMMTPAVKSGWRRSARSVKPRSRASRVQAVGATHTGELAAIELGHGMAPVVAIPESPLGLGTGLVRVGTTGLELAGAHLEMKGDLLVHGSGHRRAAPGQGEREDAANAGRQRHGRDQAVRSAANTASAYRVNAEVRATSCVRPAAVSV